jgi:hypothetical protein
VPRDRATEGARADAFAADLSIVIAVRDRRLIADLLYDECRRLEEESRRRRPSSGKRSLDDRADRLRMYADRLIKG